MSHDESSAYRMLRDDFNALCTQNWGHIQQIATLCNEVERLERENQALALEVQALKR